ncbi:superfamily I DNA/RNA helicase [Chitinophaga polysaccharea]|uniref:DNA 3'-5' helicase n=1 Tax=Chitinophaga polysaccharea TaxID=1293035 RepID=A0A561PNB5_9BACT|nr:ATP-dependent helicase [Chitinophaga polysaccharea]TWF39613.1 superfamily I DNA/RNA helicase [Chitinophaga polysaccharea]
MAITPQQLQNAKLIQDAAAQDRNQTIRLVAGPGTGKSFVIEGRVYWLLANQNIPAESIVAISFTRAAAKDLKERIYNFCIGKNQPTVNNVRVSTLHSLALYILRQTGNLNRYPVSPTIMDDWELSEIFDAEFSKTANLNSKRCGEIRRDHEAFWSTGVWNPPNLAIINPVTQVERNTFTAFYTPRTQAYSCVLPGEIVRTCVEQIQAGLIDPVAVLGIQHLIVDEVQDLNSCDFDFINELVQRGVNVFISGDDDQSVYSFRHAYPQGIQNFTNKYPASSNHILDACFRCTSSILTSALQVITNFPAPNRIPKNLTSVYLASNPVNPGFTQSNIFNSPAQEARYIANSCLSLINQGVLPQKIMILISNKRAQLQQITTELDRLNIGYDANQRDEFKDTNHGRFFQSILRIIDDNTDYVAHRVLLGTPRRIGITTCNNITDKVVANNLNYRNIFYNQLPAGVFTNREINTINKAKTNIANIQNWNLNETINTRSNDINNLFINNFTTAELTSWQNFINGLPADMTLEELKDFLQTDSQQEKDKIINTVNERLNANQQNPNQAVAANKIRIMTFHSSKGLSADVVFIPGLEENIFPNPFAIQVPGLILESARLLYVAITRAKAACILSYTRYRVVNGTNTAMTPSRFCAATGTVFNQQNNSEFTNGEVQTILTSITNLS